MILLWTTVFVVAVHQVTSLNREGEKCDGCKSSGAGVSEKINVNLSLVGTIERINDCKNETELGTTNEARGVTLNVTETTQGLPGVTQGAAACPQNLFTLVAGGCFKVVPGLTVGLIAAQRCKEYARANNFPEKDVGLGMIRNDEQNDAVLRLALENESVTSYGEDPEKPFHWKHLWTGVWHTAPEGTVDPVWRYARTNETVVYFNWNKGEPNNRGTLEERCVQQYLYAGNASVPKEVGKWNDIACLQYSKAVLCEYKESASSADNHGKTAA